MDKSEIKPLIAKPNDTVAGRNSLKRLLGTLVIKDYQKQQLLMLMCS